ncbi:hypothetical protein JCM8097_000859 [Rhodosporidiobolus ruineniae]
MDGELEAAAAFLASYLPPPADERFSRRLTSALAQRYEHHWHSDDPERGSAYRALIRDHHQLDCSIRLAAGQAGLVDGDVEEALAKRADSHLALGDRWTLWVDPGCVSLRVEPADGAAPRDSQFIEIYGRLPDSIRTYALPLDKVLEAASSNISPDLEPDQLPASTALLSPVKRSRAIQIVAPPGGRGALQAMTNAALHPDSPGPAASAPLPKPTALLASPMIIPPTPVRPLPAAEADVFSPTPSTSAGSSSTLLLPPRSPSPGNTSKYGSLSPTSYRPSSPLGMPLFTRRSSSRTSSVSSHGGDSSSCCSDGETSGTDSLFSASGDSIASLTSAGSAFLPGGVAAPTALWKGADAKSRDLVDADGFRVPALPLSRPASTAPFGHSRGSSISSLAPPPSPSSSRLLASPSRSLPGSPTKPRRRGVRGGQGHRSTAEGGSGHSHSSSISSLTSVTSTATPSTPSQLLSATGENIQRTRTPSASSSRSRTESQQNTVATEYSNGLVKVLGGGVLLGCSSAKSSSGADGGRGGSRSTTPNGEPGSAQGEGGRRRRRERGRGGRHASGNNGQGGMSGATSPMGSFSIPAGAVSPVGGYAPTSPVWMHPQASPFGGHYQYGGYGASPMQA